MCVCPSVSLRMHTRTNTLTHNGEYLYTYDGVERDHVFIGNQREQLQKEPAQDIRIVMLKVDVCVLEDSLPRRPMQALASRTCISPARPGCR